MLLLRWRKLPFLRTPAFIFCLPWGRPCSNHAKRCMNEKTIQCLPTPSQHVPIYLQQFPSYRAASAKNRSFHVQQHTFLFPLETPLRLSRNTFRGWKDNSMLAKPLAACTIYLQWFSSYTMLKSMRKSKNRYFHVTQPTFLFPLETPLRLSCNMLHGWKDNSMLAKPLAAYTYLSSIVSALYDA